MNKITQERLQSAGWTADRHVDYSGIEKAYSNNGLKMPDELRTFFERFAFLVIKYPRSCGDVESHYFNPIGVFMNYERTEFETMFDDYNINGTVYPLGFMYRGEMTLFWHELGYYLYMDGGPLICIGDSLDIMMDNLIGCIVNNWRYID